MAAEQIELRFACPDDAQTLALMSRDLIEIGLGWTYRAARVSGLIRDPDAVALVTREGPRTVGFAIMSFGDERAHLVLLAVRPTHRRRGIARRMLRWLFESAAIAGMASIHVELRADNTPAYTMYRALGFAETFRVPRYYAGRETAVRMVLVLRAPGVVAPAWRPPTMEK
jgi:ribosomal-protein-alanine N-acetyltransferase